MVRLQCWLPESLVRAIMYEGATEQGMSKRMKTYALPEQVVEHSTIGIVMRAFKPSIGRITISG